MVPTGTYVNSIPLLNAKGKPIIVVKPKKKRPPRKRKTKHTATPAILAIMKYQEQQRKKQCSPKGPVWKEMV